MSARTPRILLVLTFLLLIPAAAFAQSRRPTRAARAAAIASTVSIADRTLKVCVAANAPADVREAATAVLAAVGTDPLLKVFAAGKPPTELTDTAALAGARPEMRAYCHLVIIGLMDDPLVKAASQREARMTGPRTLYAFGFGYLAGDIGYVESDRNPFLHGNAIKVAPFETEVVTITGTTPAGVLLAAHAFLAHGLVNGVVAAPGWTRPQPNLLTRDPLPPTFTIPAFIPTAAGGLPGIGVTQGAEDEYRGVLADTGVEPTAIWRVKYHRPDAWDGAGAASAMADYAAGLHRRAYEDTFWCARFPSAAAATAAAPKIAHAAGLRADGAVYRGTQPTYAAGYGGGGADHPLTLWQHGDWLLMSTLPAGPTEDLVRGVGFVPAG